MYSLQACYKTPKDSDLRNSGVYCIENKTNGKQYIGSTINAIYHRVQGHLCSLKKGTHHSSILQKSFDKHGVDSFSLKILEVVPREDFNVARDREQFWIDTLKPFYINCTMSTSKPLIVQ